MRKKHESRAPHIKKAKSENGRLRTDNDHKQQRTSPPPDNVAGGDYRENLRYLPPAGWQKIRPDPGLVRNKRYFNLRVELVYA